MRRINPHGARREPTAVKSQAVFHSRLSKVTIALVDKQKVANSVVGYGDVEPAIPVDINGMDRKPLANGQPGGGIDNMNACIACNIDKDAAIVSIELGLRTPKVSRRTIGATDACQAIVNCRIDLP